MLKQHNCFGINNFICLNGVHRLLERPLQHFNILAFIDQASAVAAKVVVRVLSDKEEQFFGHRPGAHIGFEYLFDLGYLKASFFFGFCDDASLRRAVVQKSGR